MGRMQLGPRTRVPAVPTCDLWGLHHCFLEEGFCLCKWEEPLWCSAQTLIPSGSLWGEAVLLVRWERLQAIYQGPWHLLAWQAVDAGFRVSTSPPWEAQSSPELQPTAAWPAQSPWGWELVPPLWLLGGQLLFLHRIFL